MRQKSMSSREAADQTVRDIRRRTRKQYSAEEKIRIVLSGLRGEDSIAELCRREGIAESLYYSWSKEFLEAGKKRLSGDTARQASSGEVKDLRHEMRDLKEALAEQVLENRLRSGLLMVCFDLPVHQKAHQDRARPSCKGHGTVEPTVPAKSLRSPPRSNSERASHA